MNVAPEIKKLQDSIQRSKVQRAEPLTFGERFRAGADLYDEGMRWMRSMIEAENPDWTAEQVEQEIDRRKRIAKKLTMPGCFKSASPMMSNASFEALLALS